jgi:hypothetical protein
MESEIVTLITSRLASVLFLVFILMPVNRLDATAERQSPTASELVRAVQDKGVLANETGYIPQILTLLVSGTRFANHVNVNRPLEDSSLNFYLLSHELHTRIDTPRAILQSGILGNCAYVGVSNVIICDSDFIDRFLFEHGVFSQVSKDMLPEAKREYQPAFVAWVLGHELGHVVAGDAPAHFEVANALEQKRMAAIALVQETESAADLYAARQIEKDKQLTTSLEAMLMLLIDQEVAEKNGKSPSYGVGLHWDYANERIIQYFANQDHPEFVIRATRILTVIAADTHDQALKALIDTFARHLVQVDGENH